jgi:hypothetical protein
VARFCFGLCLQLAFHTGFALPSFSRPDKSRILGDFYLSDIVYMISLKSENHSQGKGSVEPSLC